MGTITLGHFQASEEAINGVTEVLRSGRLSYGDRCREFEDRFSSFHECKYGVMSNSGTSSLLVALEALAEQNKWNEKSEVILPALTFVATLNAVYQSGLIPKLVDVDGETWNIDTEKIPGAITDRTVAIMPVHLFGNPVDMTRVGRIAADHSLSVIEDACECVGGQWNGMKVGSHGRIGCFSTYAAHHLVTGVGGVATTNDEHLAQIMRSLVNHGITTKSLPNGRFYDPSMLGREFRFDRVGHSFRVTEMEAALGLAALDTLDLDLEGRIGNAFLLEALLRDAGLDDYIQLPKVLPKASPSWMVYPILCKRAKAKPVIERLNRCGIEARMAMPLTNQPYHDFESDKYPVSEYINDHGFYVGCHQGLSDGQIRELAKTVWRAVLAESKRHKRVII